MSLSKEIIIKKDNGVKVRLHVSLYIVSYGEIPILWNVNAYICLPGKRKFHNVLDTDNYTYRKLDSKGRDKWHLDKIKEYLTDDEILNGKLLLWESIKPS